MLCCICDSEVEKQYTPDGKMFWDQGHNPEPVMTGEGKRCCDKCNEFVIVVRLKKLLNTRKSKDLSSLN